MRPSRRQVSVSLPAPLCRELARRAAALGTTIDALIQAAVAADLRRQAGPKAPPRSAGRPPSLS